MNCAGCGEELEVFVNLLGATEVYHLECHDKKLREESNE